MRNTQNSSNSGAFIRKIGVVTLIPMTLVAGPLVGFAFGYLIDSKWPTDPWGKTFLSLLGFIAGVRQVIKLIQEINTEKNGK